MVSFCPMKELKSTELCAFFGLFLACSEYTCWRTHYEELNVIVGKPQVPFGRFNLYYS